MSFFLILIQFVVFTKELQTLFQTSAASDAYYRAKNITEFKKKITESLKNITELYY